MTECQTKASEIAEQLAVFRKENGFTQTDLARLLNVSVTQINHFLANKYKGDLEGLVNKVVNLINSYNRKQRIAKDRPVYVDTSMAQRIHTLIESTIAFSADEGTIGLIIGDAGHGKSHCLRQYAQSNKNSIYIELDDAMNTTTMFAAIADQLKLDASGRMAAITRGIAGNLKHRDMTIILDEASSLTVKQLNLLRQIIVVKGRSALILAGNRELMVRVLQNKENRGCEALDQFTSRLMAILDLDELAANKGGDGGLYTVEDIRKLYQYGGVRIATDGVKLLQQICRSSRSGRLRTCSRVITALHTSPEVQADCLINADRIVATIEQLGLPLMKWLPISAREAQRLAAEEQESVAAAG